MIRQRLHAVAESACPLRAEHHLQNTPTPSILEVSVSALCGSSKELQSGVAHSDLEASHGQPRVTLVNTVLLTTNDGGAEQLDLTRCADVVG